MMTVVWDGDRTLTLAETTYGEWMYENQCHQIVGHVEGKDRLDAVRAIEQGRWFEGDPYEKARKPSVEEMVCAPPALAE